jgi:HAD superfamily hydrolase (TIGR01509 family)
MGLSAVLFDMDGLLVDTEPLWLRAEHATLAELGGTWSAADQAAILGASMAHAARYMKRRSGTDLPEDAVAAILVDRMLVELADATIPIQPGAGELLSEVAASGVPYALVSASVRPIVDLVLAALVRAGLPGFPLTIAGDEVERSKPDPLPYLRAARALGIDITRAVVLEDSANGVRAASEAGAVVLAVPHAVPIEPAVRIHVRRSLVGVGLADLRRLVSDG